MDFVHLDHHLLSVVEDEGFRLLMADPHVQHKFNQLHKPHLQLFECMSHVVVEPHCTVYWWKLWTLSCALRLLLTHQETCPMHGESQRKKFTLLYGIMPGTWKRPWRLWFFPAQQHGANTPAHRVRVPGFCLRAKTLILKQSKHIVGHFKKRCRKTK